MASPTGVTRFRRNALVVLVVCLASALIAPASLAQTPPPDRFARGLDQAEQAREVCRQDGLEVVENVLGQCTHGEDPPPPGLNILKDVKPVAGAAAAAPATGEPAQLTVQAAPVFACDGDGTAGYRTQVIYAVSSDRTNRYPTYQASIVQWAWEADQIYRRSAQETGGLRRIRFVHNPDCSPTVLNVTLSPSGDDNFSNTINELQNLGHSRSDRKYMIFMDANHLCGVGSIWADDRPGQQNYNNIGPDYGRIDAGCWSGHVAAHEHMHNLGGVQNSAPNASGGNHCTDEYDVMCYSDAPNYPAMQFACPSGSRNSTHFDCNYNDYFNTNPPSGSYLAEKWNAANSRFLATDAGSQPASTTCPDQAMEPDEGYTAAGSLTLGVTLPRALCAVGDQDWMSFQAVANQSYRAQIVSKASSITPAIEIYAANGKKLLASATPAAGTLAVLNFRARTGGKHFVRVANINGSYPAAITNTYELRVSLLISNGSAVGGFGYNAYNQVGATQLGEVITGLGGTQTADAVEVSAGFLHSAAVLSNGSVRTWGWNPSGQLGNGSTADSAAAVQVSGLSGVASVSTGALHTVALKADGTVWAWGHNGLGQLGDGTTADRLTPVRVSGLTDIVEISAGWYHNLALKRDGTVWAWGFNGYSALGNGTTVDRSTPVKLSLSKVTGIAAGALHSLAVLEDGTARSWGLNDQGQLGDGTRITRSTPVVVKGLNNTYRVSAGFLHSLALRNDGRVLAWGNNGSQQVGGNPGPDSLFPTTVRCSSDPSCPNEGGPVAILNGIVWVAAGGLHNAVLAEDGTVWGWGWNGFGVLGTGNLVNSGTAVKVTGLTAGGVSAGLYHGLYRR